MSIVISPMLPNAFNILMLPRLVSMLSMRTNRQASMFYITNVITGCLSDIGNVSAPMLASALISPVSPFYCVRTNVECSPGKYIDLALILVRYTCTFPSEYVAS